MYEDKAIEELNLLEELIKTKIRECRDEIHNLISILSSDVYKQLSTLEDKVMHEIQMAKERLK